MKKAWFLILAAVACVTLAACGKSETEGTSSASAELPYIYAEKTVDDGKFIVSCEQFIQSYESVFNQFMERVDEIDHVTLTQNKDNPAQYDLQFDEEASTVQLVFSRKEKMISDPSEKFDTIVVNSEGRRVDDDQPFAYAMYMMLLTNNNEQPVSRVTTNLDHLHKTAKTGFKTKKVSTLTIDGMDCTLDTTYQNLSFTITNHSEKSEAQDASEAEHLF